MHGILRPTQEVTTSGPKALADETVLWFKRNRLFVLLVLLPTLLVAGYYYLIASDQYMSEAHFVVRSAQKGAAPSGAGLSAALGLSSALNQAQSDAMSVNEYLQSSSAVELLRRRIDLVSLFNRPNVDLLSRLNDDNPAPETLLKFFRGHVDIDFNLETGISSIVVRAFTPADSKAIADALLERGEERVNALNERSYRDAVRMSRQQLTEAENALASVQRRLTAYRTLGGDLDPEGSGKAQIGLVTALQGSLAEAKARLAAMRGIISPTSPQYVAMAAQVRALEGQVAAQDARLTQGKSSIAESLGGYQELLVRQEFAVKRFETAAAAYEAARLDAVRQQLYVVRIVDANLPVKALYPERGRIVLTVFFSLLVAYGIGWLIVAGIREHVV